MDQEVVDQDDVVPVHMSIAIGSRVDQSI